MSLNTWMSKLPDNRSLSNLSIPGTHDSATYIANAMTLASMALPGVGIAQAYIQCQTADFPAQFNMGVRFLDIRVRMFNDTVTLCHGSVPLLLPLSVAFEKADDFLKVNQSETIILCVKNDGDGKDSGTIFKEILRLAGKYGCYADYTAPRLGDVRGRIVLVNRIHAEPGGGMHFDFPYNAVEKRETRQADGSKISFLVQDVFEPETAWNHSTLTNKREKIAEGYRRTEQVDFRIAFLSGSTTLRSPAQYAAYINKYVWRYLGDWADGRPWITVMDYVGDHGVGADDCVAAVIDGNDFSDGVAQRHILKAGETLKPGEALHSPNKTYQAIFQPDGNFVVYRLSDGYAMRASGTDGKAATRATLQSDGNFVVYAGDKALAATGTNGSGDGARLEMQNDGNLVLYNAKDKAQWASRSKGF